MSIANFVDRGVIPRASFSQPVAFLSGIVFLIAFLLSWVLPIVALARRDRGISGVFEGVAILGLWMTTLLAMVPLVQ